ncbi:hypothetical protein U9M48_025667 [Paspalum notatum var. saurae]|uniref:SWIM-type domain-containing protein n=1 Tax=Paspalum notatum var. saurae TaxID=547442 RepID=A0AAQ3TR67_PASNO
MEGNPMSIDEPSQETLKLAFSSGASITGERQAQDSTAIDGSSVAEPGTKSFSAYGNEMDVQTARIGSPNRVPKRQLFGDGMSKQSIVHTGAAEDRDAREAGPYRAGGSRHRSANGAGSSEVANSRNCAQFNERRGHRLDEGTSSGVPLTPPASARLPVDEVNWGSELTPPATLTEAEIATPDNERTYSHDPSIDTSLVPKEGMAFRTEKDACSFYERYAKAAGFGVYKGNKRTYSRILHCKNNGVGKYYKKDPLERVRNKTSQKTKCKAKLKLKKILGKQKKVEGVEIEQAFLLHNHVLLPSGRSTSNMRSHKEKDPMLMELLDELQDCDVPAHTAKNVMREMHGGIENVPITDRDMENRRAKNLREDHKNDIEKLLEFFKNCQSQNPQFRWNVKLDHEGKVHSLFWSHASMQGEYADFGDVIAFDTTHKTNIYDKPLAMFVGGNNHLKNTLFACALVGDETVDTFRWLFKSFKQCMRKNRTRCILTDQDQAMAVAVGFEFPRAIHRICRWHVVYKESAKLKELYRLHKKEFFQEKFNSVLNHPLTPAEFEAAWDEVLTECKLHGDPTLESLYQQREKFIPAYFKSDYCGRMTSTQRSESMNFSMKKGYVGKRTALHRFAKKTLHFMDDLRMKHSTKAYLGMSKVVAKNKWPFEVKISEYYTQAVFKDFERKMYECSAYNIEDDKERAGNGYLVKHTNKNSKITWGQHQFKVFADKCKGEYRCECKEWEHTGLLCVHLLRTFIHIQLDEIPGKYILKRYSREARNKVNFEREDKLLGGRRGTMLNFRTRRVLRWYSPVLREATLSDAACERAEYVLGKLVEELKLIPPDIGQSSSNVNSRITEEVGSEESGGEEDNADKEWEESIPAVENINDIVGKDLVEEDRLVSRGDSIKEGGKSDGIPMMHSTVSHQSGVPGNEMEIRDAVTEGGRAINLIAPPRSKPKGRNVPSSEKEVLTLGAKGVKKGTRKCKTCGVYATHNSATCPTKPEIQARLAANKNKTRGRPPGSRNRISQIPGGGGSQEGCSSNRVACMGLHSERPVTRGKNKKTNLYVEVDSEPELLEDTDSDGGVSMMEEDE